MVKLSKSETRKAKRTRESFCFLLTGGKAMIFNNIITQDSKIQKESIKAVILFIFRAINASQFTKHLKEVYNLDSKACLEVRTSINNNGYIMMHVKPYLFKCFKEDIQEKKKYMPIAVKYGVKEKDAQLVKYMDRDVYEKLDPLKEYMALSPMKLKHFMEKNYKTLYTYTSKYVYRKMRFLFSSANGVSDVDLIHDCILHGYMHLLLAYPKILKELHALNICKRAIHNHGMNIIRKMTSKSRNNFNIENGNEIRTVEYTEWIEHAHKKYQADHEDSATIYNAVNIDIMNKSMSSLMCLQLINMQPTKKKKKILHIMMGLHHRGFSKWLQESQFVRATDRMPNDDLADKLYVTERGIHTYKRYVQEYIGITDVKLDKFLQKIKPWMIN